MIKSDPYQTYCQTYLILSSAPNSQLPKILVRCGFNFQTQIILIMNWKKINFQTQIMLQIKT